MRARICMATLAFVSGCQPAASGSSLDHVFEKTRRDPKAALKSCQVEFTQSPALKDADQYVTAIANFVMTRNPNTFKDVYAPESFCVSVREHSAVNAFAVAESREIVFFTGMLEVLATDSHAAAVMAHELAHVTMQHDENAEADDVEQSVRWLEKGPALKTRLVAIEGEQAQLDKRQEDVYVEQERLESALDAAQNQEVLVARTELERLFEAVRSEVDAKIMSGREDYLTFFNLGMMLAPPAPRQSLENLPHDFAGSSATPDFQELRTKVDAYLAKRTAWIAAEERTSPELATRYRTLVATSRDISRGYAAIYNARDSIVSELHELRKSIQGASAAENWKEKEADDVGLEFYLRAGLAPLNYQGMFDLFTAQEQENAAACALQIETSLPERGSGSHPTACWRYYNAKVLEMSAHTAPYESLVAKANQTTIFPGQLEDLKRSLAALREDVP